MSQFRTDTQLTLLSRIPVMLLSFISVIFLTRLLGPEGNGVYTFTIAVLNLCLTVIGFQLEGSLPVFLAKQRDNTNEIITATGVLALLTVLACTIFMTIAVFIIPGGYKWVIPHAQSAPFFFIVIILLFILRRTSALILGILRGLFQFKAFNGYMLLNQFIPAALYTMLFFFSISSGQTISIVACFKIILVVESLLLFIGVLVLWRNNLFTFSNNFRDFIKPIYTYSIKNLAGTTGHFLNKRLDVWFVQFYRGTAMLGQYGLATQIANFVSDAMTPLNQVMTPYLSGSPAEEHKAIVERTARLNMSIALIASIVILSTSWLFIPYIFGRDFNGAISASQILAIGIVFISQRLVFSDYFRAINQLRHPAIAAWSGVVLTITLDILLIPLYGIEGAAWATTIAYGTSATYLVMRAKKNLGFTLMSILFIRSSDMKWLLSGKGKTL